MGELVCVTGGSGFIATMLIKRLLDLGYTVRATVRYPENPLKVAHLKSLPYANERLELFKADLEDEGSFHIAIDGCSGVFHTASPFFFKTTDPEKDLVTPAVKGTLNVLDSCKRAGTVRRVVLTSSTAAVVYNGPRKPEDCVDESFFSDPDYCRSNNLWYQLSKTLAESEAWKFANEHGLDLVTINPAMVIGKKLQPTMNTSSEIVLNYVNGSTTKYPNNVLGWVDVKDVVEAHILAFEKPEAKGRYLCLERVVHTKDIISILRTIYPFFPIPKECVATSDKLTPVYKFTNAKLTGLGLKFTPIEEALRETVECLIDQGYVKVEELVNEVIHPKPL